jgi:hypothetical protein
MVPWLDLTHRCASLVELSGEDRMLRALVAIAFLSMPATLLAQAAALAIPRTQFIADMDTQFRKMDADKNGQLTRI